MGYSMNRKMTLLIILSLGSAISARILSVATSQVLQEVARDAVAGDTILVSPGNYLLSKGSSLDPGNLPTGKGLVWIGSNGTAAHPIVLAGTDIHNPPVIRGESYSSGYGIHVTGDYVVLKNLVIHTIDKGIVFDNASDGIIEDCEIYNSGAELVHFRDASSRNRANRNHLYSSGNGGNGSIGEGFYVGTDQARWGAPDIDSSGWGDLAKTEGYGGYDYRVENTEITCNLISAISAEPFDIKEGTRFTVVKNNMIVGDSIGLKPGAQSYDDSFIDLKGVGATIKANQFFAGGNNIVKFVSEVKRQFSHIPASLTVDKNTSAWCDESGTDKNICRATENEIVDEITDPRTTCAEIFSLGSLTGIKNKSNERVFRIKSFSPKFDLLGRQYR